MSLSHNTITKANTAPGIGARVLRQFASDVHYGTLVITAPGGSETRIEGKAPGPQAALTLRNWRPLRLLFMRGDLGFAESYMDGDWYSPDLATLLEFAARNIAPLDSRLAGLLPMRALGRILRLLRTNTRKGSRRNIAFHYDLGNAFYAEWLDRQMIYSSGIYDDPDTSLEDAQRKKIGRIVELLDLKGGESVLEIGCGWGALAAKLAPNASKVTAITLSSEQLAYSTRTVAQAGMDDKVELALRDYRDVKGNFDRIVSVEMIEAVGEIYWPRYFQALRQALSPGGKAVLQAITIREDRFEHYKSNADFIQTYIFPGGMLPTKTVIAEHAGAAGLRLAGSENFGESYALTLRDWRRRFLLAWPKIEALGFTQRFRRLWEYYLCYCEAGFRAGTIDVGLYVLEG